jgi:hypothetical protein
MSQRVKTSARGLVLPRSSSPENGHLRKNIGSPPSGIGDSLPIWLSPSGPCFYCFQRFLNYLAFPFVLALRIPDECYSRNA